MRVLLHPHLCLSALGIIRLVHFSQPCVWVVLSHCGFKSHFSSWTIFYLGLIYVPQMWSSVHGILKVLHTESQSYPVGIYTHRWPEIQELDKNYNKQVPAMEP